MPKPTTTSATPKKVRKPKTKPASHTFTDSFASSCEIFNTTYQGCLGPLKPNSVDAIITDPPYAISRTTGFKSVVGGVDRFAISMDFGDWDNAFTLTDLQEFLFLAYTRLKKGGTIVVFYDLWKLQDISTALGRAGFKQLRFLEWLKTNPVPINSQRNYLTNSREIAVSAVKGGKPCFNSSYDNGVYNYPIYHGKDRFHPTQKPLQLMEALVEKHSQPGDLIVDPFAGSGTTLIAALRRGRNARGSEPSNDYYPKLVSRLSTLL